MCKGWRGDGGERPGLPAFWCILTRLRGRRSVSGAPAWPGCSVWSAVRPTALVCLRASFGSSHRLGTCCSTLVAGPRAAGPLCALGAPRWEGRPPQAADASTQKTLGVCALPAARERVAAAKRLRRDMTGARVRAPDACFWWHGCLRCRHTAINFFQQEKHAAHI